MRQFPVGGQPSSSLQSTPPLYAPATQLQFPLPPGAQQVWGKGAGGTLDSEADTPALGQLESL
jgi:hypothetical protein